MGFFTGPLVSKLDAGDCEVELLLQEAEAGASRSHWHDRGV
jgi:hypothetical protein